MKRAILIMLVVFANAHAQRATQAPAVPTDSSVVHAIRNHSAIPRRPKAKRPAKLLKRAKFVDVHHDERMEPSDTTAISQVM